MPQWVWWVAGAIVAYAVCYWVANTGYPWLTRFFGLGRFYRELPPHKNYSELAFNMSRVAAYLHDHSPKRGAGVVGYSFTGSWQYRLGSDIDMLIRYANGVVDDNADTHHRSPKGLVKRG